ncbi:WD40 repeat-like protein [Russula emetica]|nr:WD40 repeat-like protein [Russula emetica]
MVQSNVNSSKAQQPHEPQPSQKIGKTRRHRRPKSKHREILAESPPPEASTSVSAEQQKSWQWVSITEPPTTKHPPIFTKDGSHFFSIVSSSVKIYSTSTGLVVSTLSAKRDAGSHTNAITSVILNPHNAYQLITGSLDGHIKVWDLLDGVLLQTIGVGNPVHHIAAHKQWKDVLFVAVARSNKRGKADGDGDNDIILRVSLKPSPATLHLPVQASSESIAVGKTRATRGLAVSAGGSWLVAIGGHKAYVASIHNLKAGFVKFVSPEALTCLALHPTEEYFATGDEKGNIRLWYCLNDAIAVPKAEVEKRAPTSTLHWHAHAISALTFTPNGSYLLSGGEESVLVIWQIHSGKKEFVPRVGAPIDSMVVSRTQNGEEDYLLRLADASLVFISSAKLKISRSYSGIKLDPAVSHSRPSASAPTPLTVHSLSSTLILPSSHPSSLQAYSPSSSKLFSELEVSPSNRVSRKDEKMLEPSRVERAVVSSSGEWLATIDSREGDGSFHGEVHLKVWRWENSTALWTLNTRIDRPHGLARVTSIVFSPDDCSGNPLLATSGEDGSVKSWRIRTVVNKKAGTSDVFWVARSRLTFKREIPWSISWSPDGSLLAVGFGAYVAIYDPPSNALIRTFTTSELRGPVRSVHFLGHEGRFLAVAGRSDVVLWDLVTQKVQWHHRSAHPISAVISHPRDENLAVFTSRPPGSTVSVFESSKSSPRNTYNLPFSLRNIVWYPQSSSKAKETSAFRLVGITDNWDVMVCGDDVHPLAGEGSVARGLLTSSQEPSKRTLFQDIWGDSALTGALDPLIQKKVASTAPRNGQEIADIFGGPAYMIPPLETLFEPIMTHFLTARPPEDETIRVPGLPGEDAEDTNMDVDEPQADARVSGTRAERVVDAREMDALIHLFRHHGVKAPSPISHTPLSNGHAEIQNNAYRKVNGHSHTPKPKANSKLHSSPAISNDHPSSENPSLTAPKPSPVATGKKRKTIAVS